MVSPQLRATLNRINWHHGRGDIVDIAHDEAGGNVRRNMPHLGTDVRYFTFPKVGFVRYLGQTRKLRG
jgi:hypothetical protein